MRRGSEEGLTGAAKALGIIELQLFLEQFV